MNKNEYADLKDMKPEYWNRDWLYWQYYINRLSLRDVAKLANTSCSTIITWMKKYNLKRRNKSESISGKNHQFYNKPLSIEHRERIGKGLRFGRRGKNRHHRYINSYGYVMLYMPWHPNAQGGKWIPEHTLKASQALGRPLKKRKEIVHHINTNKTDNRNCNLLICSQSYHRYLHGKMAKLYATEHFGGL